MALLMCTMKIGQAEAVMDRCSGCGELDECTTVDVFTPDEHGDIVPEWRVLCSECLYKTITDFMDNMTRTGPSGYRAIL